MTIFLLLLLSLFLSLSFSLSLYLSGVPLILHAKHKRSCFALRGKLSSLLQVLKSWYAIREATKMQWRCSIKENYFLVSRCHHHHHHVVLPARISLTLSRHFSLSFISSGRSSRLHPVSSHSSRMYVRAGRPAFVRSYVGVHRSTSLMSSSLLLQQCPACLFRLTWIVFVMGGRWPYSWCFVGCCLQVSSNDR